MSLKNENIYKCIERFHSDGVTNLILHNVEMKTTFKIILGSVQII